MLTNKNSQVVTTFLLKFALHGHFKGVGLEYSRQLYFHCLLKYMVICAFENPPQFQASWQHRLFTLDISSLIIFYPFSFYLSIAVLLVFLYLIIAANKSVLALYACVHKISLKYIFPEQIAIEARSVTHFMRQPFFPLNFKGLSNKKY